MKKKHFQCFWECPFWWPEVRITRIRSCRNFTFQWHWLTQTHVWLSWWFDWRHKFKKKDKESFDDLHQCLVRDAKQQSERDFLCMSILNGITDGTKMCRSKRVGNCFVLLCVMHTHSGQKFMCMRKWKIGQSPWKKSNIAWNCTYHLNVGLMNHIQGHRLNNLRRLLAFSSIW